MNDIVERVNLAGPREHQRTHAERGEGVQLAGLEQNQSTVGSAGFRSTSLSDGMAPLSAGSKAVRRRTGKQSGDGLKRNVAVVFIMGENLGRAASRPQSLAANLRAAGQQK